jgi:hypothetical protein
MSMEPFALNIVRNTFVCIHLKVCNLVVDWCRCVKSAFLLGKVLSRMLQHIVLVADADVL